MIFRMGVYMMRRWEQFVRDHPDTKELPPIFPLLIHHSDTGWTAATAFQDLVVTGPDLQSELLPYIPRFEMRLIDLSEGQASDLRARSPRSAGWCSGACRWRVTTHAWCGRSTASGAQ